MYTMFAHNVVFAHTLLAAGLVFYDVSELPAHPRADTGCYGSVYNSPETRAFASVRCYTSLCSTEVQQMSDNVCTLHESQHTYHTNVQIMCDQTFTAL